MRTIIFSDSHLTTTFEPKKYQHLSRIIESADRIIINGDFWDGYLVNFDEFINSEWKKLFPILKSKETIYIYGNHDKKEFADDRISYFSNKQLDRIDLDEGNISFRIEHGHMIASSPELYLPILRNKQLIKIDHFFEDLGVKFLTKKFLYVAYITNYKLKLYARKNLLENQILICGHSHLQEYKPNEKFINTGVNRSGLIQYAVIQGDQIELKDESY